MQGQAAAAKALEEAMAATREAAQRVDATVSILRQVQVRRAFWALVQHSVPAYTSAFASAQELLPWAV